VNTAHISAHAKQSWAFKIGRFGTFRFTGKIMTVSQKHAPLDIIDVTSLRRVSGRRRFLQALKPSEQVPPTLLLELQILSPMRYAKRRRKVATR
jgi:hypothetical protein